MTARITGLWLTAFTSFEMARYRDRIPSATPVRLWTLDTLLRSYS